MTNGLTTQLRQKAHELLAIADELDKQAAFPRLLNAASRRLCVKQAADIAGLSTRQTYRLASQLGERVNGRWTIDEERWRTHLARMAKLRHPMASDGERACFGASANQQSSTREDET